MLVDDGFGLFWLIVIAGVGGSLLEPASAAALSALVDARVMAPALAGVETDLMAEVVFDFADFFFFDFFFLVVVVVVVVASATPADSAAAFLFAFRARAAFWARFRSPSLCLAIAFGWYGLGEYYYCPVQQNER